MKLKNPEITFLVGREGTTIEVIDTISRTTFIKITLTPEQLSSALSRLAHTPCEVEVEHLERVGKKKETKNISFPMPENSEFKDRDKIAYQEALLYTPNGWETSKYFGSKSNWSYDQETKVTTCHTKIFRWI